MNIEVSEHEMINRFGDSMRRAGSIAKQFMTATEPEKPALFVNFIHELKIAAGSAHQISIYRENTHLLTIRDTLEGIIDIGQTTPVFTSAQAGMWFKIKQSLDRLGENGVKLATGKAMSREDVLSNLTFREAKARAESQSGTSEAGGNQGFLNG